MLWINSVVLACYTKKKQKQNFHRIVLYNQWFLVIRFLVCCPAQDLNSGINLRPEPLPASRETGRAKFNWFTVWEPSKKRQML